MELNRETQLAEPSPIVLEIRARMNKLDRVDEIVGVVDSMREAFRSQNQRLNVTSGSPTSWTS
jgi:hypothetical protein